MADGEEEGEEENEGEEEEGEGEPGVERGERGSHCTNRGGGEPESAASPTPCPPPSCRRTFGLKRSALFGEEGDLGDGDDQVAQNLGP